MPKFHCYRCDTMKNASAFTWRKNGRRFTACKECNKEMARERRARIKAGIPAAHPEFNPHAKKDN